MLTLRVLVVDDDEDMRMLCRLGIELEGHEFLGARDGVEALALLESHEVDVVVLDLMMPGLDGMSVLAALADHDHPPVVMCSARTAPSDQIKALELGAVDFVVKPFSPLGLPTLLSDIAAMSPSRLEARRSQRLAQLLNPAMGRT